MSRKKILITGHMGFIGKAMGDFLSALDYEVIGFDVNDGDIAHFDIKEKYDELSHVFHFAARTFVPSSWENPVPYYEVNTLGTLRVLELCRRCGCGMTYLNTYVYGQPEYLPVDEKHPIVPASPYNHSKLLGEEICEFYYRNMGVNTNVFRLFNVYGPGQKEVFLIPEIIKQVLDEKAPAIKVLDLTPRRDYIYIDDVLEVIHAGMDRCNGFNIYNIGSGESLSVEQIIEVIQRVAGTHKPVISASQTRVNEVLDVVANISKAKEQLRFCPKTDFSQGIEKILSAQKGETL